jgi:hypothetical protein
MLAIALIAALGLAGCAGSGGGGGGTTTSGGSSSLMAMSRCTRAHGVPNFPDPTFAPGGKGAGISSQINRSSPAFRAAAKACRNVGTPIPGAG